MQPAQHRCVSGRFLPTSPATLGVRDPFCFARTILSATLECCVTCRLKSARTRRDDVTCTHAARSWIRHCSRCAIRFPIRSGIAATSEFISFRRGPATPLRHAPPRRATPRRAQRQASVSFSKDFWSPACPRVSPAGFQIIFFPFLWFFPPGARRGLRCAGAACPALSARQISPSMSKRYLIFLSSKSTLKTNFRDFTSKRRRLDIQCRKLVALRPTFASISTLNASRGRRECLLLGLPPKHFHVDMNMTVANGAIKRTEQFKWQGWVRWRLARRRTWARRECGRERGREGGVGEGCGREGRRNKRKKQWIPHPLHPFLLQR